MQIDKEGKLVLSFEMDRPANSAASSRPSRDQDDAWHITGGAARLTKINLPQ
jgi:hypothetical protein